jgi:peroxiredoxin
MKRLIYIFITVVAIACSNKEKKAADGGWDITVSGKVKFVASEGQIRFEELTPNDNPKVDSVNVGPDGSYSKSLHLTEPGYYRVNFFNLQTVDLVLDKSDVTINVDGNDPSGAYEITGSPDYDLIRDVQKQFENFAQNPAVKTIEGSWGASVQAANDANAKKDVAAQKVAEKKIGELQDQYMELHYIAYDSIVKSLESKPVNLGLINLLQGNTFEKDRYYAFYKQVADKAIAQWPNSVHVKQFNDMVGKMAVTAIGSKAPEISLPDPSGKTITLSSLQGKYVLVDFWAFWCKPCRKENPNVVKAYKEFKNKGFEVFGVSLDRSKDDWLSAIKEDGLTWTHVSDLKYFESQAAIDYNINAIPFSILVDPNGVIVAKNLRGNALQKKLAEVFNKKS